MFLPSLIPWEGRLVLQFFLLLLEQLQLLQPGGVMISLGKQITAVGCQLKASIVFTKKNLENSEQNCNEFF